MVVISINYDINKIHLLKYNSTKPILDGVTMIDIKKSIKENLKPQKEDTKIYTIRIRVDKENKFPLRISIPIGMVSKFRCRQTIVIRCFHLN